MKNIPWAKKIQLAAVLAVTVVFLALPVQAKPVEVNWYQPYYEHQAALTLPVDDRVDTAFVLSGQIDDKYNALLVRVARGADETYYYLPARKNQVEGSVYLRFGKGNYKVEINLVKPNPDDPAVIQFDRLAGTQLENTAEADRRNLLPSWGIESDDPAIVSKAREITKGLKDDYQKVKAIHDWVTKNISYDVVKYKAGRFYDNEGAVKALNSKTGLCRDYSNLTAALLRAVGIEAKTVTGEAGNSGSWYGHAWNEAKVGGRWISLDTTWDAGYVRGSSFISRYSSKYFDQEAGLFNRTHKKAADAF